MNITESVYLPTRAKWRAWLKKHHATKKEIWLIYFKKGSGKPRVEYGDAVEEALCFGWIDSTMKPIDDKCYAQRYTPRKAGSNWSTPNLIRVKRLVADGLMTPAGAVHLPTARQAKAFHRKHQRRLSAPTSATPDLTAALRGNAKAAAAWKVLAPGYRRNYVRWITDAKQKETRKRRIEIIVLNLARGKKRW